ncbi:UDP-glucose 4-epimerase GalE [Bradyrhizobium sp. AUGA SZCCT0222]|uniref:UDP-glucose 4-epimerase GalE n=1 Tax=Bradyrhizobium sp. AUGA SZCCT0222 TaxID=2807668 RepID=UPI001BAB6246|nr:UDP-glucose 4-epimerase GalE [Bradyrhizobium sp. AUGA SZCCT0222]MBR1269498.1 UDP-glucose 4-epimerase GalE [Bradyrhizobium sp. AUGA SZCCT0222]
MAVLVTGGAGYIGAHTVLALLERGLCPIVLDDLSAGFGDFVPRNVELVVGDIGNRDLVIDVIQKNKIDTIIHFAGKVDVAESIANPMEYYLTNTIKAHSIIKAAANSGIKNFIFSSTAAVYGRSESSLVHEASPLAPISPYGRSKLMTEQILSDAHAAHGLNYAILRYFNVAGADPGGRCGQVTRNATHLIKTALSVITGRRPFIEIYGDDYSTPDGSCIRDFIHVSDVASAHIFALEHLQTAGESITLNCGYGRGYSVKEVLKAVETVTGKTIPKRIASRRIGDPMSLVSDSSRLRGLGWKPKFDNLSTIIEHAYSWEMTLANYDPE